MQITEILNLVENIEYSAFFYTPKIYHTGKSIHFKTPFETIKAKNKTEFLDQLSQIDLLLAKGYKGYGTINYEAGYLLEDRLNPLFKESENPIMEFHFFENDQIEYFTASGIEYNGVDKILKERRFRINNFQINTGKEEYINNIERIRNFIKEGDTYQVNYTVKGKFEFTGDIKSLFLNLIFNQSAEYSSLIHAKDKFIISISPELFFSADGKNITAKPMKGTSGRGLTFDEDKLKTSDLRNSKKDRAENVMILDLLRNDLGKISHFNSVRPSGQFNIDKFETLFQMTSTVNAELRNNQFSEIIKNIFPCGSITGAPKIRTMRIISELEKEERGIYTGGIGVIEKNSYKFNVPIRTIKILNNKLSEVGIGSGVVWDSDPEEEYKETLLKSNFLTSPEKYFEIFESILIENRRPFLIDEHLNRMKDAADYFLFNFDIEETRFKINEFIAALKDDIKYKLKVELDKWGKIKISSSEVSLSEVGIKVLISDKMISTTNKFQYFKTSNRIVYDDELNECKGKGFSEVIFLNEKNEIAEGSITNIFILKNNEWLTPNVSSGILSGVYRNYFIKKNKNSRECSISINDLKSADRIILVNSIRREITVNEIRTEVSGDLIYESKDI